MEKLIQYCTKSSYYDGDFNSTVGWHAAGMGYILVTENGKLIVIDGGKPNDTEDFLALLEQQAGGKRPEVELWIMTHPHSDHFGVLHTICHTPELLARVKIRALLYRFPEDFVEQNGKASNIDANRMMAELAALCGADCHAPELDERMSVDGLEFHFLYYPYDCRIINHAFNCNASSMIFTVQAKNKKIMFTGDAVSRNLQVVTWIYHKKLKCDILQMPHHALCDTGLLKFYKEVDAKILLEPTCIAGDRAMHTEYVGKAHAPDNAWAEENAEQIHRTFEGTVEIPL